MHKVTLNVLLRETWKALHSGPVSCTLRSEPVSRIAHVCARTHTHHMHVCTHHTRTHTTHIHVTHTTHTHMQYTMCTCTHHMHMHTHAPPPTTHIPPTHPHTCTYHIHKHTHTHNTHTCIGTHKPSLTSDTQLDLLREEGLGLLARELRGCLSAGRVFGHKPEQVIEQFI